MTIEINLNNNFSKAEGVGLTGEAGKGLELKPPYGMPGAYKYKVRKKENVFVYNPKTK